MPDSSRPNDPDPIGDPAAFFDTDEVRPIRNPPPVAPKSALDGYDLEGGNFPSDDELPQPIPIPIPIPADRPKPRPKPKVEAPRVEEEGSREFSAEVSGVDPEWSRWGEWGPDAIRAGSVGLGTLFLAWCFGFTTLGAMILVVGGLATALLCYPLLVTLERPVRITPEQAVTDFYAAASHHFPHYRRMWLLLSSLGHRSGPFSTFEEFRDHWKGRVNRWRSAHGAGKITPLKFEVEDFRADKSTGKETSRADYKVNVFLRGRESEGPIESVRMAHGLVKGPDRMWYLNRGTLEPGSK